MSRKLYIHDALSVPLKPELLTIENESYRHKVPEGAETHFKVTVVSEQFDGLNRIARHRLVNAILAEEFKKGLHALSLHLYTPGEWKMRGGETPTTPDCQKKKAPQ